VELIFRNVTIIDGTGAAGAVGDVGVVGDRIAAVGRSVESNGDVAEVIDGTGLTLTPGFVDAHTHDDGAVLADPDHGCKTLQGVTSVVVGNCGVSPAPASDHTPGLTVFGRMTDYLDALEAAPAAVNVAALVGHGAIRAAVMGLRDDREPEPAELDAMLAHLRDALAGGAVGMSSGLAYEPGRYAAHDELVEFNTLVANAGGIYTTHMRDEGDNLLDSIDESIAVAEATGVPLQISHLKAAGRNNWGSVVDAMARIDAARGRGVDVMADQYPYTRGSSLLEQVVSGGALDGPSAFGHCTPAEVLVAAAPGRPEWEGQTIAEIADDVGIDGREMADRIIDEEGRACIVVLDTMAEDDVRTVMANRAVMVGSDGVPMGQKPHPRLHHTYPRVLGRYVRELGVLELADAVKKMTSVPAERFGFAGRGIIREGAYADLVLFDPTQILDTGTYSDPTTVPAGIAAVWVNGRAVVRDGAVTGERPGAVVRGRSMS